MIAYFATFNGRVLVHEFGSSNLDRRATQMFVNRNNGAVARRSGNDSKPYAVLVVEFEPRPADSLKITPGQFVRVEQTTGWATSKPKTTVLSGIAGFDEEGTLRAGGVNLTQDADGYFAKGVVVLSVADAAPRYFAGQELGTNAWCVQEYHVGGPRVSPRFSGSDAQQQAEEQAAEMNAAEAKWQTAFPSEDADATDEETAVAAAPKKLGEMTPAERAAAVKSAAQRFQAELEANAPAIAEILEEERVATPADIVKRLQDSQYPLTAITALGWGMGPAQLGITDAVIEAERQGLVVTSMHNGKQMVTLALQDDEVPARPVPAPLALLRAYNAAHAHEAIVAIEEPTEAEVARCRDNGQHLLSSRHRAVECPIAAELAKAEVLAGADDEMELVDPRITDAAVEARCIATWNRFPEWDPATQASYRRTARFTLLAKLAAQPVDEMEPVDQTAAAARAAVAYTEGLEEGLRRSAEHLDAYLGKLKGVSLMQKSDLKRLADEIRAGLKDADATRSPLWYGGNR